MGISPFTSSSSSSTKNTQFLALCWTTFFGLKSVKWMIQIKNTLYRKDAKSSVHMVLYHRAKLIVGLPRNLNFIQNYFLWRRIFYFFGNRDKCRKSGFKRQKYTLQKWCKVECSHGTLSQGEINCGASSEPDIIQDYFLWRRMFYFFGNRDKCRKSSFNRQTCTLCLAALFNIISAHKPLLITSNHKTIFRSIYINIWMKI